MPMYKPEYRSKSNKLPVLSKQEIDDIGERFVAEFCPQALTSPCAIDIDMFAQEYLGLNQDFQYLSNNGIYLGMMVFDDTDRVVIYNPAENVADYVSAAARTIIIDNGLLDKNQEHRYRFTMGHEASHDILHSAYFNYAYNPNQMTLFGAMPVAPTVQCRIDSGKLPTKDKKGTDSDWMEFQANRLSSAILMPTSAVRMVAVAEKPHRAAFQAAKCVLEVSKIFNVSLQAAEIRLRELNTLNGISKQAIQDELTLFAY